MSENGHVVDKIYHGIFVPRLKNWSEDNFIFHVGSIFHDHFMVGTGRNVLSETVLVERKQGQQFLGDKEEQVDCETGVHSASN